MDAKRRIATGAPGGVGGTVVLTGLRRGLEAAGLMDESAPDQVVARGDGDGPMTEAAVGAAWGLSFYALTHKDRGITS